MKILPRKIYQCYECPFFDTEGYAENRYGSCKLLIARNYTNVQIYPYEISTMCPLEDGVEEKTPTIDPEGGLDIRLFEI